jgi:hypothetical protein
MSVAQDRDAILAFLGALHRVDAYARDHLKGMDRPSDILRLARSQRSIAPKGVIGEALEYNVHGAGCRFVLDGAEVDIDFTSDGACTFDSWRLDAFVEAQPAPEPEEPRDWETACRLLVAEGFLQQIRPGWFAPA